MDSSSPSSTPNTTYHSSDTTVEPKKLWKREEIHELIKLYSRRPELWDVKSKAYRNHTAKRKAYAAIGAEFGTNGTDVWRKMHSLRTQYSQEVKKMKAVIESGRGGPDYKRCWEFFDDFQFLGTAMSGGMKKSDEEHVKYEHTNCYYHSESQKQNDSKPIIVSNVLIKAAFNPLKPVTESSKVEEDPLENRKSLSPPKKPVDDHQIFGDYIATELRTLKSDEKRRKLKRMILKAILEITDADED